MIFLAALLVLQSAVTAQIPDSPAETDCVVLLHGMARTAKSMRVMAEALRDDGYIVANEGYPSREHPIETLAPMAIGAGIASCREQGAGGKVHFVAHSLGSILVRYYHAQNPIPDLGRVVMLGPPNQGSTAADKWRGVPGFNWLNGPAGKQLGKGAGSIPLQLGKPDFEFGVIAGDRSIDPLTSLLVGGPDDGRVAVAETRLDGMRDFRRLHTTHAFMMRNKKVIAHTLHFLRTGSFEKDG